MNQFIKNLEFAQVFRFADQVSYLPGQIVSKTLAQNESVSLTLFAFDEGEEIELDMDKGVLKNERTGKEYKVKKLPEFMLEILNNGGLIPYLKEKLKEEM